MEVTMVVGVDTHKDTHSAALLNQLGVPQAGVEVAASSQGYRELLCWARSLSPARVWVYDRKTLQPLEYFGEPGIAPGQFNVLHHMTTDVKGNLYTSEVEDGRRVQKFVFKGTVAVPVSTIPGVFWHAQTGFPAKP